MKIIMILLRENVMMPCVWGENVDHVSERWYSFVYALMNEAFKLLSVKDKVMSVPWMDKYCKKRRKEILELAKYSVEGTNIQMIKEYRYKSVVKVKKGWFRAITASTLEQCVDTDPRLFGRPLTHYHVINKKQSVCSNYEKVKKHMVDMGKIPMQEYFDISFENYCITF